MTQSEERHEQFTFHVSVAQRWWLRHLPDASQADRFLHERLRSGAVQLIAADTLQFHVLDEIAKDLGEDLDPVLARGLASDVSASFALMQAERILGLVPHQPLLQEAVLTTSLHHISLSDALAMTLAQASGWPLLLADWVTFQALQALPPMQPTLPLAWLPDQLRV